MQDIIMREITVKANKERVYAALTDPKQISTWFPDAIEEGTLEVGQSPIFVFSKWNHRTRIHVEAAKPYEYFAYRWVPSSVSAETVADVLSVPNTLVEFFIEELEVGTKVTVKESGFASLPEAVAENSFKQNSGGWETVMGSFENAMNK
jgi:uncharacterized protein YndB with AHSA1/START domain